MRRRFVIDSEGNANEVPHPDEERREEIEAAEDEARAKLAADVKESIRQDIEALRRGRSVRR